MKCPNCGFKINAAKLMGKKGGLARMKTMTPEERSERARHAVQAREKKRNLPSEKKS